MPTRFGTDGVRGVANAELTPELVLALGRAAARVLPAATFVVGRDTRRSGPLLQAALSAGLAAEGADVIDAGVLPTPAVAWLSAARDVPGAVISASHNPFADNGVKLFAKGGVKLSVEEEAAIEDALERILDPAARPPRSPEGHGVGRITAEPGVGDRYADSLASVLDGRRLDGLRLVLDCANGAASALGARVYEQLGAEVVAIGVEPDGANINAGVGSTHTETCRRRWWPTGPTWAWPSTATPTGCWRWTPPGPWPAVTSCWPCSPSTWPTAASWRGTRWWSPS